MATLRDKLGALHDYRSGGGTYAVVAARWRLSAPTLRRIVRQCEGLNTAKSLQTALSDGREARSGRKKSHDGDYALFLCALLKLWLHPSQPTLKRSYDLTCLRARGEGWDIPPLHWARTQVNRVPIEQRVLARQGNEALHNLYPTQERHVFDLAPLDVVNADGWPLDVFVQLPPLPTGAPRGVTRPCLWALQDVRTRKIVSWALVEKECADVILQTVADCCVEHGVPRELVLDNTRAASAAWLSGKRLRGGDKVSGVLDEAGISVNRTHLIATGGKTASGKAAHRGWGGGKPVERVFKDFAKDVATHPELREFYTGASTSKKPSHYNHGRTGADWRLVEKVIAAVVADYNSATGRKAIPLEETGESSDQLFARLVADTPPRVCSNDLLFLLLAPGETTKIKRDGTFTLAAGAGVGFGKNRYHHPLLLNFVGDKVRVRFNPTNLYAPVHVSLIGKDGEDGKFVCTADVLLRAGFSDREKAQIHNRARTAMMRETKRANAALLEMQEAEVAAISEAHIGKIHTPATKAQEAVVSANEAEEKATGTYGADVASRRVREARAKMRQQQNDEFFSISNL